MTVETVRYTYRLRPGKQAEAALLAEWGRSRWLWNECVHQMRERRGAGLTRLSKLLTEARGQNSWLRAGARCPQEQTVRTFTIAYRHWFTVKRARRPVAKTLKRSLPSLNYAGNGFRLSGGRLQLAGGIVIPVVWSRNLPSVSKSVRIFRDALGHWYASFVVRRECIETVPGVGAIGIDWGVRATATTTDPAYDLPYAGHRARCAAELAKAQRRMARRHRPGLAASRGYLDAKRRAAQLHKKAARQNTAESRAWAQRVVRDHQMIAIEDFRPRFLASTRMARKAQDAAIASAKRELIDAGRRAGRDVVIVKPAYTSMTCSECGARTKQRLELSQRTFRCDSCGYMADRDRNAARTILATAVRSRAGADDVSRHLVPLAGLSVAV